MAEQGWYHDPFHVHEDRYFSDGTPTKLVRDEDGEHYDDPPATPVAEVLVPVEEPEVTDGEDLLRADDAEHDPPYDEKAYEDEITTVYGPV